MTTPAQYRAQAALLRKSAIEKLGLAEQHELSDMLSVSEIERLLLKQKETQGLAAKAFPRNRR